MDYFSLHSNFGIEELISSECEYLVKLQMIIDGYYKPTKSCISPPELKNNSMVIFGNILDIYLFHSDFFFPQLKDCQTISDITKCFNINIPNFNLYTLYCSNKYESSRFLNLYTGSFFEELRKCLNERLSLNDLLIAPIQRLMHYHLLLRNIQIHSTSKEQIESISSAMKLMKSLPAESSDKIHLSMIKDYFGCVENHGKLLFHGYIQGIFSSKDVSNLFEIDHPLDYYVFLFDFLFIVTRKHFNYLTFICDYKTSSLKILVSVFANNSNSFAIISSDNHSFPRFNVQTMDSFEKCKWISVFYNLSQEQQLFSSVLTNPISLYIPSVDSIDDNLDDTNTIFWGDEFEILPFENNYDYLNQKYTTKTFGKNICIVLDVTSSIQLEMIIANQLKLNVGEICQILFSSIAEFSFVRSQRGQDICEGWVPSNSIQITDSSLSSDLRRLKEAPFIKFRPELFKDSVFAIERLVSHGAYSIQYRCKSSSSFKDILGVAMKNSNLSRVLSIAEISYVISNENLPTFYGVLRDGERIFQLFVDCGDRLLFNSIAFRDFYTESEVMNYMLQIWKALNFLRIIGVVHLDIRPENLYLSTEKDIVKLVDFTCAQAVTHDGNLRVYQQIKGSDFRSPEQLMGTNIFHSSDQWASGVVMYTLLIGCSPFGGNTDLSTRFNILHGCFSIDFTAMATVSSHAKDLIVKIFQQNQKERITAAHCISHNIFPSISQLHLNIFKSKPLRDYLAQRSLLLNA